MEPIRHRILSEVKNCVEYLLLQLFPSGNLPSSLESAKSDRLVQWCHGAPGLVHLLAQAYKVIHPPCSIPYPHPYIPYPHPYIPYPHPYISHILIPSPLSHILIPSPLYPPIYPISSPPYIPYPPPRDRGRDMGIGVAVWG